MPLETPVQARVSDDGKFVQVGFFTSTGEMQSIKTISADQADELVDDLIDAISDIKAR